MKTILHPAGERGHADHGWLNAHHSFSFANWYDPSKIHFGVLRVLNDDIVESGQGFGMHPHNDMEIITIILEGALQHKDNMGNGSVIRKGDVQVMSAGTGVLHSEFNPSEQERVNLFQIWIFPKEKSIKPRYGERSFPIAERNNKFQMIASGFKKKDELYIHQDAAISLINPDAGFQINYPIAKPGNGVYVMVIKGRIKAGGQVLNERDAIGIWDTDSVQLEAVENSEVLILDVPMN